MSVNKNSTIAISLMTILTLGPAESFQQKAMKKAKAARVMKAMMEMDKIGIAALKRAYQEN